MSDLAYDYHSPLLVHVYLLIVHVYLFIVHVYLLTTLLETSEGSFKNIVPLIEEVNPDMDSKYS